MLAPYGEGLEGAAFAKLFPAVQVLVLDADYDTKEIMYYHNVAGMTALTHLWLRHGLDGDNHPDTFTAIATLPRLQCLLIDAPYDNLQQLSVLSRLSTLQALALQVHGFAEGADCAVVLSAFSSLTTLHTLCIEAGCSSADYTTLGLAVSKLPRSLRHLKIDLLGYDLSALARITIHPGLRNLVCRLPGHESVMRVELDKLVGDCRQRGLRISSVD